MSGEDPERDRADAIGNRSHGLPHPQTFEYVLSSMCTVPHPAARDAALRFLTSNPGDPHTFPAIAKVEREVVDRLGTITGLRDPAGYVASGGTEANIQAVRAAVQRVDTAEPNVVVPDSAHFSFRKAAHICGIELRSVPTSDFRADPDAIARAVDEDTAVVVGVAGSTEYGRVDPIPALADIAMDVGADVHVDAAWGGFLLPFSDHRWDFEIEGVTSITMDPHKTGRAPIPAGGLLVRDPDRLDNLAIETPYLESGTQVTLTGTRSGGGVAGAWVALEELWPDGYRRESERAMRDAEWLASSFEARGYRVVPPELPIVAVDLPRQEFEALRDRDWRIARTAAGETRIVVMPHVTRARLEAFLETLDALEG